MKPLEQDKGNLIMSPCGSQYEQSSAGAAEQGFFKLVDEFLVLAKNEPT